MVETKLFTSLQIGSMTLRNRTFMAPMSLGYESQDGTVNERMQQYWLERAKGGVGCIILDALSVDPRMPYLGNTLCFRSEESIAQYKQFTDKIHAQGAKIIPQITHPGPESVIAFHGIAPLASSSYINSMGQQTRAVKLEEIPALIQQYAQCSLQAKQAGFDGIELHCAHGYMLLGSFLSPMRNKRCDAYGGSLWNRARLLFEVIDAIKETCGKDFPIILRISGDEKDAQGNSIDDICELVPALIEHGIDAFEISGGVQYEHPNKIIPSHGEKEGLNVEQARKIKSVSSVPVIVVGKILDPHMALNIIQQDYVDGVVLGRSLLADPYFVKKTEAKQFDEIAPCTGCVVGCVGEQTKRHPASCVINPFCGRECEWSITSTKDPKHIGIVGGGPAGMAAARILALRGHKVTLMEKTDRLGGQLCMACVPPHKQAISKWVVYLLHELERLNVNIKYQFEATAMSLKEANFDHVIIATGAKETLPPIPGVDDEAITAWQLLNSEKTILGGNVLVVGGGMVGCEISEYLNHTKRGELHITMIEMADAIAKEMVVNERIPMMQRLHEEGVQMLCNTKLCEVNENQVVLEVRGEKVVRNDFTHIVYACGARSNQSLYEEVKDDISCSLVGDANAIGQALEAIREATALALKL